MFSDGSSFIKRVAVFRAELERGRYPNAGSLAQLSNCSRSTAQRVIDRLRDEYLVPICYDSSKKGYYIADGHFDFDTLPPGKDELTALLLVRDLANTLGDPELTRGVSTLWTQYQSANAKAGVELDEVMRHFSCDSSEVAMLADNGAITYLNMAARGESVALQYKSPWRHKEPQLYRGRILHVHLENGNLYLLFWDEEGNERILNTAFVQSVQVLDFSLELPKRQGAIKASNWLEGFGVWSGAPLEEVEIAIFPPASHYYARQRWDETQEDSWDGEVLVRRMQAILSPELVRRILGLGRFVKSVKPVELRHVVQRDAALLAESLGRRSASASEGALS